MKKLIPIFLMLFISCTSQSKYDAVISENKQLKKEKLYTQIRDCLSNKQYYNALGILDLLESKYPEVFSEEQYKTIMTTINKDKDEIEKNKKLQLELLLKNTRLLHAEITTFYYDSLIISDYQNNNNIIYLWFDINKGETKPFIALLTIQYCVKGEKYQTPQELFVKNCIISIDGEQRYKYTGKFEREENDYFKYILEKSVESFNEKTFELINALISSNKAEIRFIGKSNKFYDFEIPREQIEALKNILDLYLLLGGRIWQIFNENNSAIHNK
jgi:hypothetical protein